MKCKIVVGLSMMFYFNLSFANAQSENLVNICENAAYATDYVYIDQYVVSVDTDTIDQFESEVMWVELHNSNITILSVPVPYERGDYVFNKGTVFFYIQGDLKNRVSLQRRLSNLSALSSVRVSCRYII